MASDRESLLSMGFEPARVEWALKATGNRGLQPAMDHILENDGKPVPDLNAAPTSSTAQGSAVVPMDVDDDDDDEADNAVLRSIVAKSGTAISAADLEAKSIKCSECGKIFKNTALANFHAEKSGHDQFEESTEEIKPLTEEEKKQKLAELREKMSSKRAAKAKEEAKEQQASEVLRRKAGKDMHKIKEDLQAKEIQKETEQKRRDKLLDAKAKAAVMEKIEADKRARAEKAARKKALLEGTPIVDAPESTSAAAAASPSSGTSGVAGKDYKETRLQIRLASGGQPYTATLSSDATLREVAEFLAGQTLSVDVETVSFAQHFPRKAFSQADFNRTLRDLGLTPSAVLIAS